MVYVKVTAEIRELVQTAEMKRMLGCEKYCDKQIISFDDLELLATVLNLRLKHKDCSDEKCQHSLRKECKDTRSHGKPDYETVVIKNLVDNSQVLFIKEHFCNWSLKPDQDITQDGKQLYYFANII